jgi:hypothetical protein
MSGSIPRIFPNRKDTRGLPEGYDPYHLYRYRFEKLKESAEGLEWYLYKYIPFDLIRSFAVAIDPTARFKVAPNAITGTNRHRYRAPFSVLNYRSVVNSREVTSYASGVNYQLIGGCISPFTYPNNFTDSYTLQLTTQAALPDEIHDTSGKTRLYGSKNGELDLFKSFINSPSRSVSTSQINSSVFVGVFTNPNDPCKLAGGSDTYRSGGTDVHRSTTNGPGATLSKTTFDAFVASEYDYNIGLSQAHAVAMLKEYSPFNRSYSLFRNLAELHDLPASVLSLKETTLHLRDLFNSLSAATKLRRSIFSLGEVAHDIPNEYLSYHFGWKQTYKDIMDLLSAPGKTSKKLNFLLSRSGQPTTFRTKRSFVSGESDVSGFDYEVLPNEFLDGANHDGVKTSISRSSELRLVINATFDFPPISTPEFAKRIWLNRLGIVPRVTDVYNLVPWTWLVDYFTGLGNYVECIDNINHDPSLINWGLLTCVTKGKLTSNYKSSTFYSSRSYANNTEVYRDDHIDRHNHTSVLEYECHTRRDMANILDVKCTSEPTSLSDYQKSIIGAILAQRDGTGHRNRSG